LTLQSAGVFKLDVAIQEIKYLLGFEPMTLQFKVPNMACSACANTITKAVIAVDPTAEVEADPKTKLVNIKTQQSETEIKQAIAAAGYPAA
jgi:copper chaperone